MRGNGRRVISSLRRQALGLRMIEHEVRTEVICDWTGLTQERVRSLYRGYRHEFPDAVPVRRRGPSPRKMSFFLRSALMRSELAAVGGLCRALKVISKSKLWDARRRLPSLERGEHLFDALAAYARLVPDTRMTAEAAIALLEKLAEGELDIGRCQLCTAAVLLDGSAGGPQVCMHCEAAPS